MSSLCTAADVSPMPRHIEIVTALEELTADIADHEITDRDGVPVHNPATLTWRKRERAIELLYAALCEAALAAWVCLSPGDYVQLTSIAWKGAKLWRDIILGGVVLVLPPEEIERYEDEHVLLDAEAFEAWRLRRLPPADVEESPADVPAVDVPKIVAGVPEPPAEEPADLGIGEGVAEQRGLEVRPEDVSDLVWAVMQALGALEVEGGLAGLGGLRREVLLGRVRDRLPGRTVSLRTLDTALAARR